MKYRERKNRWLRNWWSLRLFQMITKRENSSIKETHLFRRINKFINWIIFVRSIFLRDFKGWTIEQGNDCLSWVTRRHTIINGRSDEKLMNAVSPVTPLVYTPRITSLSKTLMGRNSLRERRIQATKILKKIQFDAMFETLLNHEWFDFVKFIARETL